MHALLATFLLATPALAQLPVQDVFGSDTLKGEKFGGALDIDGDWMVVGARSHDGAGPESGAAYIFRRMGNQWTEVQKLVEPELDAFDRYGIGVAISGERIAVGANTDDDSDDDATGAVYTYALINGTWTRTARLTDSSLTDSAQFGFSVDLDGAWLATGAQSSPMGGAAYLYEDVGGQWILRHRIDNPDSSSTTDYGYSVAVSVADNALVVGSPRFDGLGGNAGGAYVYNLQGGFQQLLQPSGSSPAAAEFGTLVAIEDGTLVAGAPFENTVAGSDAGAVYVYTRPAGSWTEFDRLLAPDANSPDGGDLFGRRLDLNDGRLLIGAYRAESDRGHAYLYAPEAADWRLQSIFTDYQYNGTPQFGIGLALDATQVAAAINDIAPASGPLKIYDIDGGLLGGPGRLDLSNGGTQLLSIEAGAGHAGEVYLILGSRSGTAPGLVLDGALLPLNPDAYLLKTFNAPNAAPLTSSLGVLDADGRGYATFALPSGSSQSLAGIQAHHAALAIDPVGLVVSFASNAIAIDLVP